MLPVYMSNRPIHPVGPINTKKVLWFSSILFFSCIEKLSWTLQKQIIVKQVKCFVYNDSQWFSYATVYSCIPCWHLLIVSNVKWIPHFLTIVFDNVSPWLEMSKWTQKNIFLVIFQLHFRRMFINITHPSFNVDWHKDPS